MIVSHIEVVTLIVIVLFAIPIAIRAFRIKGALRTFPGVVQTFNRALIGQVLIGIVLGIVMALYDGKVYHAFASEYSIEIVMGTAYTFVIVGLFYYLPSLLLLNVVAWTVKRSP